MPQAADRAAVPDSGRDAPYQTMRLFRQPHAGPWGEPIRLLIEALRQYMLGAYTAHRAIDVQPPNPRRDSACPSPFASECRDRRPGNDRLQQRELISDENGGPKAAITVSVL